ncbi:hypothetical protein Q5752_001557 [Cryptotrichosporon argae]
MFQPDQSAYERHAAQRKRMSADTGAPGAGSTGNLSKWADVHEERERERERRSTRVSRACNGCRRSKMRCTGVDNPPCDRCRLTGEECVVEKPARPPLAAVADDRMGALEAQVAALQNHLDRIMLLLPADARASVGLPLTADEALPAFSYDTISPQQLSLPRTGTLLPAMPFPNPAADLPNGSAATSSRDSLARDKVEHHRSLPPSPRGGSEDHDVLAIKEIDNPLGVMSSMAELVEAAVQRARDEVGNGGTGNGGKRPPVDDGPSVVKRARKSVSTGAENKPDVQLFAIRQAKREAWIDAIDAGVITEAQGREFLEIFLSGSVQIAGLLDPQRDNWDSLRSRSPLLFTAVMMVGARVRDGGDPISDAQQGCFDLVESMVLSTLQHPATCVEDVQAMVLLAAFTDTKNTWLVAGHAVRSAIDLGLNRSFLQLLRTGMGTGKGAAELEREMPLVVNTRTWFALYRLEHQMSFGLGRPVILGEDSTIQQCREWLKHPLVLETDVRLVSTVELMAIRGPLHVRLSASPDQPIEGEVLDLVLAANRRLEEWESYWEALLAEQYKFEPSRFVRESVQNMRQLAELFINSQLLRGVHGPADVQRLPPVKRELAMRAMRNAKRSMDICLHSASYAKLLVFGTHYTHVCVAFVGSFLIRIARLFPDELDLRQTAKDVEQLADVLSHLPAGRYARSLRLILRRARRAHVLPPVSRMPSPPPPGVSASNESTGPTSSVHSLASAAPPGASDALPPASPITGITWGPVDFFSPTPAGLWSDPALDMAHLQRAGVNLDGELPLYLDDHALGTTAAAQLDPLGTLGAQGLEAFFIPPDLDALLAGWSAEGEVDANGASGGFMQ